MYDARELDGAESEALLRFARQTLKAYCEGRPLPAHDALDGRAQEPGAAFVTLEEQDGSLRGCMGTLLPTRSLARAVQEMTIAAASRDPRFPRVEAREVDGLRLSVTLLHPPRDVQSIDEIVVGRHGLIVERGGRRGLLLPQVATRWGWDRTTFLDQTCVKAGLPLGCWREPETRIQLFAAEEYGK